MTEIEEIQDRLQRRKMMLRDRIDKVTADLRREREPLATDFAEQAVQRENDEVLSSILENDTNELRELDDALVRLTEGRFGICESCGRPIEAARLDVVPFALRCSVCASGS